MVMMMLVRSLAQRSHFLLPKKVCRPCNHRLRIFLHQCRKDRNLLHALRLHAYMLRTGLDAHTPLGNDLVSVLVEVGSMSHAQQVFDRLGYPDECSWSLLIIGYVKGGDSWHALTLYHKMQEDDSLHPSGYAFVALLNACAMLEDLERGSILHAEIARKGLLEKDIFVGSSLVDMYAKCGSLAKAQEVLDKLPVRNVVSWTALIAGYAEHGHGEEALICVEQMQHEGISLNAFTLVCSLKACGSIGATDKGRVMHIELAKKGLLEENVFIGSALVYMYAKCGSLAESQQVFEKLPVRNVVSWNALITGYAEHGHGEDALCYFEQMLDTGISLNAVTFISSLRACGSIGALNKGREIHAKIARKGLERELMISNILVDMYAKCGSLAEAQEVFDKISIKDVVSWTALITGYAEHGRGEEALCCLERMPHEGIALNAVAFVCSLKACGSIGAPAKGQEIHAEIARKGLEREFLVGSTLVDMYVKCGSLADAQGVFDKLPIRTVVSWNALIAGYAEYGHDREALNCFKEMQNEGFSPDAVTLVCSLKSCGSIGAPEIHAEIARKGLEREVLVGNILVDMYAKCGLIAEAQEVFDKLPVRAVVPWTALVAGLTEHGHGEDALDCFEQMQQEGISLNAVTLVCSLKACGSIGATVRGREIHAEIARKGLERELLIGSTLVDMYFKCGLLADAQLVFDKIPVRDVVSWNALIAGYAEHGDGEEALKSFKAMQDEGVSLDAVTLICSLKACGRIRATEKGWEIHAKITAKGLERELLLGNSLVDMYAKCGSLAEAQKVFDKHPVHDVVSWNALITGYVEHGCGDEALRCFEQVRREGISLNAITFVCILKACGSVGATDKGREIHAEIARKGLEGELLVGNILVDVYATCGLLAEAQEVFDKLPVQELVSWNALIAGYAQLGESKKVFHVFDRMIGQGVNPDLITFVSVLNTCSHAGLVDRGQIFFEAISNVYGFIPTLEHYACMIDFLGRAGHIDKVVAMVNKMPFHPGVVVWHTMLGACRKWGNVELGRHAFEHIVQLDDKVMTAYVCMFNIYADAAMQEGANKVEW